MNTVKAKRIGNGWVEGTVDGYSFQAKVYGEGSHYGIRGGRVSKLMIWDETKKEKYGNIFKAAIANYDRGWDIEPEDTASREIVDATVAYLEKMPAEAE